MITPTSWPSSGPDLTHKDVHKIIPFATGIPVAPPVSTVPTYEDYARRVDAQWLSTEVDDSSDTNVHLYEIAAALGKWEEIAPYLGLDEVIIDDIAGSRKSANLKRFVENF